MPSQVVSQVRALFLGVPPLAYPQTPDTIVVRTYEDRTDLLRSLIIGPENTPYEDAPFVIDWMLPHDFPQSPPVAHFLSWTNGNGRGIPLCCLDSFISDEWFHYSKSVSTPNSMYELKCQPFSLEICMKKARFAFKY